MQQLDETQQKRSELPAPHYGSRKRREVMSSPLPFPSGWYALGFSEDLRPGMVTTRQFMGRDVVLFRTTSGKLGVAASHCPHLGADLGRGGTVCGESLRCPFHGFTYGPDGVCTSTPYGKPPPAARLDTLEAAEVCGVIIAYHDPSGAPATWQVEPPPEDGPAWGPRRTKTWRFRGHPQEIMENSIDLGHFQVTHHLEDPQILQPLTTDGPRMRATYTFRRPLPFMQRGLLMKLFTSSDGLGFSCHNLSVPELGWETRLFVLPTPLDETTTEFRTAFMGRTIPGASRRILTPVLKSRLGAAPTELAMMKYITFEIGRDIAIFRYKHYLPRPALTRGDSQIGPYRAWARQFYPLTVTERAPD